jgi:hypothetical protein
MYNITSNDPVSGTMELTYNILPCEFWFESTFNISNQSTYSLIPSFSLFGDTDENSNVKLGYDRDGNIREAWSFSENLYAKEMGNKENNSNRHSTFAKNTDYYPVNGNGNTRVLSSGVYLITADVGPGDCGDEDNVLSDFYNGEYSEGYGCNTLWDTSDNNPKIAIFIKETPYQITRIDTWDKNHEHRIRTFMPTLEYLPKDFNISMRWKNVH